MRNCIYEQTLQAWFDNELPADQAANVAAHLNVCVQCAEVARTIEAENLIAAKGLAIEFAGAIPTETLRERVETAIAADGDARAPVIRQPRWHPLREFFASFLPLAYAAIAATVLLAGFLGLVYLKKDRTTPVTAKNDSPAPVPVSPQNLTEQPPKPAESPSRNNKMVRVAKRTTRSRVNESDATSLSWQEHQYDFAIAKLNDAIKIQPPLRPSLEVEYQYNLAVIDNAIESSREVARKNPRDLQAAQSMLAAYQSKVDLMNQVANAR